MASIKGDLSVMPLCDLLQWVELSRKTGTVTVNFKDVEKKVYIEDGKIVYVSTNREGERLGEFMRKESHLDGDKMKSALIESQTMKIPFTQRLIDLNYFSVVQLTEIIAGCAKEMLLDAIEWKEGWFEFIEGIIPPYVMKGPVKLNTSEVLLTVIKEIDEIRMGFRRQL